MEGHNLALSMSECGDSGTYPICDSSVEFVHIDLYINSMASVVVITLVIYPYGVSPSIEEKKLLV